MKNTTDSTKKLVMTGAMTAVFCIVAPVSLPLPVSPVPVSLTSLMLYMTVFLLGQRTAAVCYLLYLLIGMLGLPVFSGFSGGAARLAGPTGGYLVGFIFTVLISGWVIEHSGGKMWKNAVGMAVSMIPAYLTGTIWLSWVSGNGFRAAIVQGVLPFLVGDAVKILIAAISGPAVRKRLKQAGVL